MRRVDVVLYCTVCGQKVRIREGSWIDPMRFRCADRRRHELLDDQLEFGLQLVERVERPRYDPEQAAVPF